MYAELYVPGEVLMIRVGSHIVLTFWDAEDFAAGVGALANGPGIPPVTLAHSVATNVEVDQILARARELGSDPVSDGVQRDWGGYSGYFTDPEGYRWEVAVTPGPIDQSLLRG